MGTTIKDLDDAVRKWAEVISGRDCFIQEEMGPIPPEPYCTIYMKELEHLNFDISLITCDGVNPITQTMRGLARVTYAVSAWGGKAHEVKQVCNRLRVSIEADDRWADIVDPEDPTIVLSPGLWALAGKSTVGSILTIPEEFEGERRQRAEFDLSLYTTLSETFNASLFDETNLTCEINGATQTATIGQIDTWANLAQPFGIITTPWSLIG